MVRKYAHPTRFKSRPKDTHTADHEYCIPVADPGNLAQEHSYSNPDSPLSTAKRLESKVNVLRKKHHVKEQQIGRLKRKVHSLKNMLKELKNRNMISTNCEDYLKRKFTGVSLDILKRAISTTKVGKKGKCSPALKAFALTLQYYSQKAYEYVRQTFNLALPHQTVLRGWFNKGC